MTRGLRFENEAQMPESMRRLLARTTLQDTQRRVRASRAGVPRLPMRHIEHDMQVAFFEAIRAAALRDPGLLVAEARTHAIPNGGHRNKAEGGRLKAEGVRAGVPDVFCALPAAGKHGLYIELKTGADRAAKVKNGKVSTAQKQWLEWSDTLGYATAVCRSDAEALAVWMAYVREA